MTMRARDPRPFPGRAVTSASDADTGDIGASDRRHQQIPPPVQGSAIIRAGYVRTDPYMPINTTPLRDTRLSWEARGLLAYLLTVAIDRRGGASPLLTLTHADTEAPNAAERALRELVRFGYVDEHTVRDPQGRLSRTLIVHDQPPGGPSEDRGENDGGPGQPPRGASPLDTGSTGEGERDGNRRP